MTNKGNLLDELHLVRDSFIPVTHFLTGRKLRDETKELFCIKKSPNCFHLIGKCSLAYPVEFLQSTSYFRSLVGFLWKRKKRSQYYSSKALQRVNKTSCLKLNLKPFHWAPLFDSFVFPILVAYYLQVSFNLKTILPVAKTTQNAVTDL